MSYRNLEVWQIARELSIEIHKMTLVLPKFEQFEEAQQIRRSSKGVRSAIVEGYGRRYYKADYIKYIIYALSSNDETIDHLETLFETQSLVDQSLYDHLHKKAELLGRKLNNFLTAIQNQHSRPHQRGETNEPDEHYFPESSIKNPEST
jgi:four helix bundle protein